MKVISSGSRYEIYEDDLKTYDQLPAQTYVVKFNPMSGFSLKRTDDFVNKEEKIYGSHECKISKVLTSYDHMERSLGIILSGDKGIGKSLFTQILAEHVIKEKNMPVIMVTKPYVGIAEYLDSIEQDIMVLFDEFEKVFSTESTENGESQQNLLGMFDGTSQKKRIYAITVNSLYNVNDYMLNRPGRFHYHFRFDYPEGEELRVYLRDKVPAEYHGEIENVVRFSQRVRLNYDCLRAIAFELSMGTTFKEAISDLNILNTDRVYYTFTLHFKNAPDIQRKCTADLFGEDTISFNASGGVDDDDYLTVRFSPKSVQTVNNLLEVDGSHVVITYSEDNEEYTKEHVKLTKITIAQSAVSTVNYSAF